MKNLFVIWFIESINAFKDKCIYQYIDCLFPDQYNFCDQHYAVTGDKTQTTAGSSTNKVMRRLPVFVHQ